MVLLCCICIWSLRRRCKTRRRFKICRRCKTRRRFYVELYLLVLLIIILFFMLTRCMKHYRTNYQSFWLVPWLLRYWIILIFFWLWSEYFWRRLNYVFLLINIWKQKRRRRNIIINWICRFASWYKL